MQAARDQQKSYADLKRKPMEFQVGDKVMLKVSPWKGVVRFGKRGKLNPRYVGPFKKCHADEPLAVPLDGLQFDDKLQFVEEPVEIMDHEVKRLKQSRISLVKKCHANEPLAVPLDGLHFDDKLHFVEEPVEIMDRKVKRLKEANPISQDSMELQTRSRFYVGT
nr:putative reverse transcriptase domain-containing protein [Tanacetum cinerariifolium]